MSTAATLREQAAAHEREARASFERCDTDGFMSQWANDITARQKRAEADIAEAGGRAAFPALFDLHGNLVAAKWVETRFGMSWVILATDDPRGQAVGWFNPSRARNAGTRRRNDARKGYYVGQVMAPARTTLAGHGRGTGGMVNTYVDTYRTDGGFSRDVQVTDNGHTGTSVAYRPEPELEVCEDW